ncbi:MAG: hypothetical protein AAGI38_24280 [Bacteroidota bacterium]
MNSAIEKDSICIDSNSAVGEKRIPIGDYLVGISKNYENIEFYLVDKDFELSDSLFVYTPNGEVYSPDFPCRIDTINWLCYFFDYEVDHEHDTWVSNLLIRFDLKTDLSLSKN